MNKSEIWKRAITVWKTESEAIKNLSKTVNKNELLSVVKAVAECNGRIVTSGTGTSAVAAKKISHSLSCIERPSFFLSPSDAVHGALGSVQKDDIAILVSKGGNTAEMVGLIDPLKLKKVLIIAVTENNRSTLAKKSDIFLKISVREEADDFNMLATTSTLAVISVFDAICVILMQYTGYTKRKFAVIHPGGAVGERLGKAKTNNKVAE